jgi:ABC-2 type transport system ATP-binding protein
LTRSEPSVLLDAVVHRYKQGTQPALNDVSQSIVSGVTGVLGVNGAGKSTLLSVISGLLQPTSGQCTVRVTDDEYRVATSSIAKRHVALMPQDLVLPPSVAVRDFLQYMAWARGLVRAERLPEVESSLEAVGLASMARARVGELSGGMKRRLLLAQALLGKPEVVLLDEPTASLDPEQRTVFREIVADRRGDAPCVVISSHEIEDLAIMCDRFLMLEQGEIVFAGTPAELKAVGTPLVTEDSPLSPLEAAFLHLRKAPLRGGTR